MVNAPDVLTRVFVAYLRQRPALIAQVISETKFDTILKALLIVTPENLMKIERALEIVQRRNR